MASFKVKLEDKAAFLNRMEKQDQAIDNHQIKDDKLKGYFEVTIDKPEQLKIAKEILKQSPKINTLSEMKKKLTKEELKEMIRQELQGVLAEKKKVKDEDKKEKLDENELNEIVTGAEADILNVIAALALGGGISIGAYLRNIASKAAAKEAEMKNLSPEEQKAAADKALQDISNDISRITGR